MSKTEPRPVLDDPLSAGLIFAEGQELTHRNKEALWEIFQAIGYTWDNTVYDSNNQRSSWYEMIKAKTENAPNYTGEYVNAIYVMEELYRLFPGKGEIIYNKFDGQLYRIEEEDIQELEARALEAKKANRKFEFEIIRKKWHEEAFHYLFFESNISHKDPPTTRLAHCKVYVVNEFIRMQMVAGAFKAWGSKFGGKRGKNYKGYLGGSRYNESSKVRAYKPK